MKLSTILETTSPRIKIEDLSQRMLDECIEDDSLDSVIVGTNNKPLEQAIDWLFNPHTGH